MSEVRSFGSEKERLVETGAEHVGTGMTNFDHSIEPGFEEALREGKYGNYAGWDFHGTVWFDGKQFCCEVWRYGSPMEVLRADTLPELMVEVSEKYGYN